jgi:hypothetical protein
MEGSHRPEGKVGKKTVEMERDFAIPTIEFNSGIELNNAFKKKSVESGISAQAIFYQVLQ